MTLITWDESMETGIGMIDAQHRILVDLINRLEQTAGEAALSETATSILHNLRQYTVYHFAAEETLMVRNGYPEFEHHRKLHRGFVEELDGLEIDALVDSPELGQSMLVFLKDWLVTHIMQEDMEFSKAVGA